MTSHYIDAHCHVQFEQYDEDRDRIIEQMREKGIAAIVVGCDLVSSQKAVALAEKHEHLFASVGVHPNHTDEAFDQEAFRELAKHPKVVAIGECGLDFFRPSLLDETEKRRQTELFTMHISLATELHKPLIIHSRPSKGTQDAYHDAHAILKEAKLAHPHLRGDMHFFVGGIPEAQAFMALDFTLSFTAVITFARDYDEVIRSVPLTSILSETDAPYVAPLSRRGQRNDPLSVVDVVNKIAEIRSEDPEILRTVLFTNTKNLFHLP